MDGTFDFVGALLLVLGAVLLFKTRQRKFHRTNAYGVERFSSYWSKLFSRTNEGVLAGVSVLLLSSGTLLLAFRYQESWGWIVLFPVCLIMLFALIGV